MSTSVHSTHTMCKLVQGIPSNKGICVQLFKTQAPLSIGFSRLEWVGCHLLLHGIFPTQGLNVSFPCSCIGRQILNHSATWEAPIRQVLAILLCLILCSPMECTPPDSSVHGILQARILEWVAISFPRGSSQPRNRTQVSFFADRFFIV